MSNITTTSFSESGQIFTLLRKKTFGIHVLTLFRQDGSGLMAGTNVKS